jgi:hypothetical protein
MRPIADNGDDRLVAALSDRQPALPPMVRHSSFKRRARRQARRRSRRLLRDLAAGLRIAAQRDGDIHLLTAESSS